MESLSRLVNESLARHGFHTTPDHSRLRWSNWFPCKESLGHLFVPSKPGLLALGEEVIAPGEIAVTGGKRMMALFRIVEAEDIGMALGRMLLKVGPERQRLVSVSCFARYAVIEDPVQRGATLKAFQNWMASPTGEGYSFGEKNDWVR